MSRPFDFFNGQKIDLSIQSHRDEVIRRNKVLEKIMKSGIDLFDCSINIRVRVKLNCPVCGCDVEDDIDNPYDGYFELDQFIPTIRCSCCETKFIYTHSDETFNLRLKTVPTP